MERVEKVEIIQCPNCNGTGKNKRIYGISDHGVGEKCPQCNTLGWLKYEQVTRVTPVKVVEE